MQVVKKSENGKVMMTKRRLGYAVCEWVGKWSPVAGSFMYEWVQRGFATEEADASVLFDMLAA